MCWVCTQPLILPVNQNPLAAFHQHQDPTAFPQAVLPFTEKFPDPDSVRLFLAAPEAA